VTHEERMWFGASAPGLPSNVIPEELVCLGHWPFDFVTEIPIHESTFRVRR